MPVPTLISELSTTPASNSPAGGESIGTNADDYIRSLMTFVKVLSNAMPEPYVYLREQQTSGTQGGVAVADTWTNRVLNTEVVDTDSICSLAANAFTLSAGTYRIRARSPFLRTNGEKIRLRNTTAGTTVLVGSSSYSDSTTSITQVDSCIVGRFTVAAAQALTIQYWANDTFALNSLGAQVGSGEVEIFTEVELWKEYVEA